jgi:hypothetical protein
MSQLDFNLELFIKNSNFDDYKIFDIVKEAIETKDEICSILRTHLFFERILEAWIYAKCNKEDFFNDTQIGFFTKLKIACNLGLFSEVYDIGERLNKIRNTIAHHVLREENQEKFNSLYEGLRDSFKNKIIVKHQEWENGNIGLKFYKENGEEEMSILWNDKSIKKHIMLAVICTLTLSYLVIKSKDI